MHAKLFNMDEQLYTKGFNHGYLLTKHEPQLAKQITAQPNDKNDYFQGIVGGKDQYEKEAREWSKSFSKGNQNRGDKGLQHER